MAAATTTTTTTTTSKDDVDDYETGKYSHGPPLYLYSTFRWIFINLILGYSTPKQPFHLPLDSCLINMINSLNGVVDTAERALLDTFDSLLTSGSTNERQ
ncbi:hypothetical protein KPH14_007560 [Odynerus spinipes]|uniref:Uncharacterized protein n=1 Tax=Odynerus spinipes TaxID=1348599 RepID=A0AAD9RHP7_9HYME|nr:hypothetical protein KPH14_007560 [Odynerus spinipes]